VDCKKRYSEALRWLPALVDGRVSWR
jgi:hypothetical protein